MAPTYVVVDGSNIATEGRSVPSLAQLDDAVRQFQGEFPGTEVIVVVDATFGHRIDPSERKGFDEAVAHAELVSPPAGAVGRGDAFLLRVAERVGAQVLSNDSFQEFHAEHPWLFDEGRLIGGKPVPGVGWIFTPRSPVRGVRSRAALGAGSAKTVASKSAGKVPRTTKASKPDEAVKPDKAAKAETAHKTAKAQKAATADKAQKTEKAGKAAKADKTVKADKAAKAAKAEKTVKADKTAKAAKAGTITDLTDAPAQARRASKARKSPGAQRESKTGSPIAEAVAAVPDDDHAWRDADQAVPDTGSTSRGRRSRGRRATAPDVRAAIDVATVEAVDPNAEPGAKTPEPSPRRRTGPPPAVNDPLTFLTFVSEHPIASAVEGTVSSFVSHGAMVDVGGMQCYVPLAGLGDPAPRRAREVIERGDRRPFVLVALDPARRGAELALPEVAPKRLAR